MGSPDSRYASSNDAPPRQSSPSKSQNTDYAEKNTYLRFLVSNAEAGSVIGKGGATIADLQSQSGARIQLSRSFEYFPGTSDRIIMVSGAMEETLKGVELILAKLLNEFYVDEGEEADPRTKVRLIVPNGSCGGLIGKGGSMIKSFIEDSQANIKISPQDNSYMGVNDRLVSIVGTLDQQMNAIDLILIKLSEDSYYMQASGPPFPYAAPHNGAPVKIQNKFNPKEDPNSSVTLGVADEHIGLVVGRGGRNIQEISQISGARIKISDRGDFMSGTSDRKVTINGTQRSIRIAEAMITHKVSSITAPAPAPEPSLSPTPLRGDEEV